LSSGCLSRPDILEIKLRLIFQPLTPSLDRGQKNHEYQKDADYFSRYHNTNLSLLVVDKLVILKEITGK
jgi:hypothetical protein